MAAVEKRKAGAPKGTNLGNTSGKGRRAGVTLTKKLGTEICERVAKGVPKTYAARASGIALNTISEWERRGRGQDERPATELTIWFANEMDKATAKFIESKVVEISDDEAWQAKAWLLERRFPDEFGRREIQRYEGVVDHTVRVELAFDPSPALTPRVQLDPAIDVEAEELP